MELSDGPGKCDNFLIIEALAVKDLAKVIVVLVAVWQSTVWCAVLSETVLSAGSVSQQHDERHEWIKVE